jgi:rSAM/selenodomain-associated transferase 1
MSTPTNTPLPLVVVYAKAPVPGRVKTRLEPDPARAAELHSAFVRETLTMLNALRGEADIEISTDEPTEAWSDLAAVRSLQSPGDLGQRMLVTLGRALEQGRPQVMILGSDSPGLPPEHLRALLRSRAEVAIGPAEDGGFYAIACRKIAPIMFEGIRWSTADTLPDTLRALERCGLTFGVGPPWFDVDTPRDLERVGLVGSNSSRTCYLAGISAHRLARLYRHVR